MNNCHLCFQFILPLLFAPELWALDPENLYKFDLEDINVTIRDTQQGITVRWSTPNKIVDPRCYKSEVEYKNQCVKDWRRLEVQNKHELTELDFSTLSTKHNYDFRIRMKLHCIDGEWSNWTRVQSWGNNKGACKLDSSFNMWMYSLVIVLPMIGLLLICLLTQEGIRKLILPVVPDPKNYKHKIMDIDQSQWWSSLGQCGEECKTTEIEIVSQTENSEDDQTVVIQSVDTMYCICSSDTPGESPEAQCSAMPVGYIAL